MPKVSPNFAIARAMAEAKYVDAGPALFCAGGLPNDGKGASTPENCDQQSEWELLPSAPASAAPVVKTGSRAMISAATATAPNDISTLIASDSVSHLARAWSRSASCAVSLPSATSRVMSRTILMARLLPTSIADTSCVSSSDLLRMRRNRLPDRQRSMPLRRDL